MLRATLPIGQTEHHTILMPRNNTANPDPSEFTAEERNRLTNGTLTDGDIPDKYNTPSEQYNSYITTYSSGVMIRTPEHAGTSFTIHPEGVPERGTPTIDFYYGRPVLYLYTPLSEELQFMFALPTNEDPQIHVLKTPYNDVKPIDEIPGCHRPSTD